MKSWTKDSGYYSLQILFIVLMVFTYLWILGIIHHFTYWRETQLRAQKVLEISLLKSQTEDSIKKKGTFVNTETRLRAIQRLVWPLVVRIRETLIFENPRQALANLDVLFSKSLHLSVARKGRILIQQGNNLDSLLGKDWARQFFVGWHQGGDVFRTKSNFLYSYPVSFDEFLSLRGRFISYNLRGQHFLQYTSSTDEFDWILLLDLQKIENEDVKKISQVSFGMAYPDLDFTDEIRYRNQVPGFFRFLLSCAPAHGLFLLLLIALLYQGGYLLLNTRFEFRLIALMSAFYGFVLMGSYVYLELGAEARLHVLFQKAKASTHGIVRALELDFADFPNLLAQEMNQQFLAGHLQKLTHIPGEFNMAFARMDKDGMRLVPPPNQDLFQHIVANSLPNLLVGASPNYKIDMETALRRFPNPMGYPMLTIPLEEIQRWNMFKSREYFQKISKFAILKDGVFGYHNYQGEGDSFEVALGITSGKGIQREFLKRWKIPSQNIQAPRHFTAASLHEDSFWYSYGNTILNREDFSLVYVQIAGRYNELISVTLNGILGYAMLIPSEVIGGVYYFYFEEETVLLQAENSYRNRVFGIWAVFIVFCSMLMYWLKGVFLNSIQKMELAIRRLRDGKLDVKLSIDNEDELSRVCSEFNLLAQEMQHRERMLPFVSEALLNVLKEASLKPEGLSGPAVVMFSDIRSFTTLCENHAAEEVVLMLNEYFEIWQQAVNRYGGLVDRFVGDAIRVVLREEVVLHPALQALAIATEVMRRLNNWNHQRQLQGKFTIRIGIGVSMGQIHLHVIKGKNKFEFFLDGDSVHEAELLESLSKHSQYMGILISDSVFRAVSNQFEFMPFNHEGLDKNRQWWQVVKL